MMKKDDKKMAKTSSYMKGGMAAKKKMAGGMTPKKKMAGGGMATKKKK
jgi:hypothetical protein